MTDDAADQSDLRAEIARLRAHLDRLEQRLAPTADDADTRDADTQEDEPVRASRRGLLKLAGATAAGAVASTALAASAAADMGYQNNGLGSGNTLVGDVVRQQLNGSRASEIGFLFTTVSSPLVANNQDATGGAALGGFALDAATPTGVKGRSTTLSGTGVMGDATAAGGIGVRGDGESGVVGNGRGPTGVGVEAWGPAYGAVLRGDLAPLRLQNTGASHLTAPEIEHVEGEISFANGELWVCVLPGTPGTWRKIASRNTAGAFHPLSGGRVYDSREPQPSPGVLSGGQNRTISVASARTTSGGTVVIPDYIPAGAIAIAANVTVASVSGGGFLACNPRGVTEVTASTINWSGPGQTIANGVILTVINRQLTIVAGGGSAHFVIDVNGYWL